MINGDDILDSAEDISVIMCCSGTDTTSRSSLILKDNHHEQSSLDGL